MKTRPEIEVFTDKKYCESNTESVCCDFITTRDSKVFCSVYREYLDGWRIIKCDECKIDYKQALIDQQNKNLKHGD